MSDIGVGNRDGLNQYELCGELAGTPAGTPLVTIRDDSIFRYLGIDPKTVSGTVIDIGSGDDSLSAELIKAGANVDMHRINPALNISNIEVYYAMTQAIYARAERLELVGRELIQYGKLHTQPFPDTPDLPQADWVFSVDCYPRIWQEYRGMLDEGLESMYLGPNVHRGVVQALARLRKPNTCIALGLVLGTPLDTKFMEAIDEYLPDMRQHRIQRNGGYVLHLMPS